MRPIHSEKSQKYINEMFQQVFEWRATFSSHQNGNEAIHRDQRKAEQDERQEPDDFVTL